MITKLQQEAYNSIIYAESRLQLKQFINYYIELAHGVGFDTGVLHNVQHGMKPVHAWNEIHSLKFGSIREASRKMRLNHSNIVRALNSKKKCGGFRWDYI